LGFYDQAHLSRRFKKYLERRPAASATFRRAASSGPRKAAFGIDDLDEVVAEFAGVFRERIHQPAQRKGERAQDGRAAGSGGRGSAASEKAPVAVWAVNQLARRDKTLLERLRRAGVAVVQAQSGAVAGRKNAALELRSASDALQRELEAALRAAGDLLRAGRHAADEATQRRVQEMLRLAAVSGGETWIGCNAERSSANHALARTC